MLPLAIAALALAGTAVIAPETKVAVHAASGKSRYSQMIVERPRFLPFFRPFRYAFAGAPATNEQLPQHRLFLFRGRL
jgi:hypothetical protein